MAGNKRIGRRGLLAATAALAAAAVLAPWRRLPRR
ncbi:twin-arginine translocation signal domain-containing protein [Streptomyces sp. NRRL S-495]|nr:twin-arginine translocation signal domain-containing protein [Streptomyces sp. NRRL S-495]